MGAVPPHVQKAIKGYQASSAPGSTIDEIELETEAGKKTYEFDLIKTDGTEVEVEIDENGAILEVEEEEESLGTK